jgi:DNA-binding NarL/FixJ family response regulator
MNKIRVVVVDDHEVVRQGLRLSLDLEPDMQVVAEARTGREAVKVVEEARPDVVLLDVRLGDIDGPEVCRRIRELNSKTAVVMLSNYLHDDLVLRSLVAGAKGYVIKDVELAELKKMIRSVYLGNAVLDPKVASHVISSATGQGGSAKHGRTFAISSARLSETDLAIIRHLVAGLTTKEIAGRVNLSPYTVKDHLEKVRAALGVGSRTEIVAEAMRRGLA